MSTVWQLVVGAWGLLPLVVFPIALSAAVLLVKGLGRIEQGRVLGAFGLMMLVDLPMRSVALTLASMMEHPVWWPLGLGLVLMFYAVSATLLLWRRRWLSNQFLRFIKAVGTEHERGLGKGSTLGLVSLGVYYALQPITMLLITFPGQR